MARSQFCTTDRHTDGLKVTERALWLCKTGNVYYYFDTKTFTENGHVFSVPLRPLGPSALRSFVSASELGNSSKKQSPQSHLEEPSPTIPPRRRSARCPRRLGHSWSLLLPPASDHPCWAVSVCFGVSIECHTMSFFGRFFAIFESVSGRVIHVSTSSMAVPSFSNGHSERYVQVHMWQCIFRCLLLV